MRTLGTLVYSATTLVVCSLAGAQTQTTRTVDFATEIHPVLESRCRSCHTGASAQAGLRVDSRDGLIQGGKSGAAIVPSRGSESLLILKVTGQRGLRMPPAGPTLSEDVVAALRRWIDQGAPWGGATAASDRLSALAPRDPPLPSGNADHPIDRFVDAYLEQNKITRPAVVSDAIFARRAYLDLHGLLPSPEGLQAFLLDPQANKRARLIDRLLADRDPYSEHWMSFWNDLLRNDEGVIYHGERRTITAWLQAALRDNMPYDRMVNALLNPAGKDDPEGFLIGVNWRGVVSASQSPPMQASQNSAQVFLGMNLKCAACHDSFVNRWKLRDTYGLAAMFAKEKLELVRCDIPTGTAAEARFPIPDLKVPFDESPASRRAAAAKWFTSPKNGRFARTLVNRYWKLLFGRGLVEPVDDMDAEPWSQDLLDWLASDFVVHGYDLQHLLRRIMSSHAYQMPAAAGPREAKQYAFRGPQLRRLTAEEFEDAVSSIGGDWRIMVRHSDTSAAFTREWRLKSDPLSRALGRPIRDQVTTERSSQATTLQALELTNGPLLAERLERESRALLGLLKPAPENVFDTTLVREGSIPIDAEITGAKELWLVIEDVDSYDPARVMAGWARAELIGPEGIVRLSELAGGPPLRDFKTKAGTVSAIPAVVPSMLHWRLEGKHFSRFRGDAVIDENSRKSDISPAVRFFVFTQKPDPERLVRIGGRPPTASPRAPGTAVELIDRLYLHLLARAPSAGERTLALGMLRGDGPVSQAGLEDLLWALLMGPEFQFIR